MRLRQSKNRLWSGTCQDLRLRPNNPRHHDGTVLHGGSSGKPIIWQTNPIVWCVILSFGFVILILSFVILSFSSLPLISVSIVRIYLGIAEHLSYWGRSSRTRSPNRSPACITGVHNQINDLHLFQVYAIVIWSKLQINLSLLCGVYAIDYLNSKALIGQNPNKSIA